MKSQTRQLAEKIQRITGDHLVSIYYYATLRMQQRNGYALLEALKDIFAEVAPNGTR